MSNKNYPGNESFTITLTDLWYFSMRSWVTGIYIGFMSRQHSSVQLVLKKLAPYSQGHQLAEDSK